MAAVIANSNPSLLHPWVLSYTKSPAGPNYQQQLPRTFPGADYNTMEVDTTTAVIGKSSMDGSGSSMLHSRKRKAETQDNERLCKRVSLLNLENGGQRLYVPVESPTASPSRANLTKTSSNPTLHVPPPASSADALLEDMLMRFDGDSAGSDTRIENTNAADDRHKVYIYDLDAELASLASSSDHDEGDYNSNEQNSPASAVIFLPDIERHLRSTRIPKSVLRPDDQGMFAGRDAKEMQLVVYGEAPRSLSVPEEQDGVRRAIIEARHRAREEGERVQERILEAQKKVRDTYYPSSQPTLTQDVLNGVSVDNMSFNGSTYVPPVSEPVKPARFSSGFGPAAGFLGTVEDDDAMDIDL